MLILVTGGAASGKSEFAEDIILENKTNRLLYIATMQVFSEEDKEKVHRHKALRRSKGFETIEAPFNLLSVKVPKNSTVLLECMSNLLANEMYSSDRNRENAVKEILDGIIMLNKQAKNLVIVTNEVFSDGIIYSNNTNDYIDNLAYINKEIASIADEVVEVVYSIPIYHKRKGEKK